MLITKFNLIICEFFFQALIKVVLYVNFPHYSTNT